MAFRTHVANHIDTGDGADCQKVFPSQQTSVRIVTYNGDAVRTGWLLGVFSDTISVIIIGTMRRHLILPPHYLSIQIHEYQLYLDKYSANARRMTCGEASSGLRRRGQDRP